MKTYKVSVPYDYMTGHLRYGHVETINVEAENIEDAKQKAKEVYRKLYDWQTVMLGRMEIEEIKEES